MSVLQKAKPRSILADLYWFACFASFLGVLFLGSVLLIENEYGGHIRNKSSIFMSLVLFTLCFILSFAHQYITTRRNKKTVAELKKFISAAEAEVSPALVAEKEMPASSGKQGSDSELAIHDNITGFYNRNALTEVAEKAIYESADDESVVFLYIGLIDYQEFLQQFGMIAGEAYIRACAELFKRFLSDRVIPFRWWGPDFLFLIKGVRSLVHFRNTLQHTILKAEAITEDVDGIEVSFHLAVGYSASRIHGNTPAELLEYASFAEHEAFRSVELSPNEFKMEHYDEARRSSLRRIFIKDTIDQNQLGIVFQPILSLRNGELFGFEALSRPTNPIYHSILELIGDAEASGHYASLEKKMVYNALAAYKDRDEKFKGQYLFINTSPYATLTESDYHDIRDRYFDKMKVVFEVIERNQMETEEFVFRKSVVTNSGAKFALDDFGSGYSNHLALLALEPDIIKIDRELIRGINDDLRKQQMLEDIISYARCRGTRVLAEGVETEEELTTVCRMNVDYVQGYFTGRPSPVLREPEEAAVKVIQGISRNHRISMQQVFQIIKNSVAMVDEDLAQKSILSAYLVMKMGERLGYSAEKLTDLAVTALFCDIGAVRPECGKWLTDGCDAVSCHCMLSYLLLKEFSPVTEYSRAVLFHHIEYHAGFQQESPSDVPEEAYLFCLANAASELILKSGDPKPGQILQQLDRTSFKPKYFTVFEELCGEQLLERIISREHQKELADFLDSMKSGKAEVEGILRTFIYSLSFQYEYAYSHTRVMETAAEILAKLTKQNWRLTEKVRIGALLFNLCCMAVGKPNPAVGLSTEDRIRLSRDSLMKTRWILQDAGLADILDMIGNMVGEKTFSEKRVLMGKDIINGSNMLMLAHSLAVLMETGCRGAGLNCGDAVEFMKRNALKLNLDMPMIEMLEEYSEDIEAHIHTTLVDLTHHTNQIINGLDALRSSF